MLLKALVIWWISSSPSLRIILLVKSFVLPISYAVLLICDTGLKAFFIREYPPKPIIIKKIGQIIRRAKSSNDSLFSRPEIEYTPLNHSLFVELDIFASKYKKLDNLVMMIGGNLVVGTGCADDIVPRFKNYGFDLVFHQIDLNTGLDTLEKFLQEREQ